MINMPFTHLQKFVLIKNKNNFTTFARCKYREGEKYVAMRVMLTVISGHAELIITIDQNDRKKRVDDEKVIGYKFAWVYRSLYWLLCMTIGGQV